MDAPRLPGNEDVRIADSRAAKESEQLSRQDCSPMLDANALRSYYFAALIDRSDGLGSDEEPLYVGCVLHDIGLTAT